MTERDSFLRAILSDPSDDTVRLVFADWLDEHGDRVEACNQRQTVALRAILSNLDDDSPRLEFARICDEYDEPERAEFIRVQYRLAGPWRSDCKEGREANELARVELVKREQELLRLVPKTDSTLTNRYEWAGGRNGPLWYTADISKCKFTRGFVSSITCTAADWLRHTNSLFWSPKQTVECDGWDVMNLANGEIHHRECNLCNGTGRIPRPFVATAQPITEVTLTDLPELSDMPYTVADLPAEFAKRWPGVTFKIGDNQ